MKLEDMSWSPQYNRLGPPKAPKRRYPNPILTQLECEHHEVAIRDYTQEINHHLSDLERSSIVSMEMIDLQPEIKWYMRPYLLDFLLEIHQTFKLEPQTYFLAVNIVDKYCSKRVVFKRHYQLVGCTALWLAAKYEDKKSRVPTLKELVIMCREAYDAETFVQMERHILSTLEWSVSHTSLEDCLQLIHRDMMDIPTKHEIEKIARMFCEISTYKRCLLQAPPSLIAIAANLLACSVMDTPIGVVHFYQAAEKYVNEFDDDATFDEDLENQLPAVVSPFLSGYSEDTIYEISKISMVLLLAFQECSQSLLNKYVDQASTVSRFIMHKAFVMEQFPSLEESTLLGADIPDHVHQNILSLLLLHLISADYDNNEVPFTAFEQPPQFMAPPQMPQSSPLTTPPSASSMSVFSEREYGMIHDTPISSPVDRYVQAGKRKRNWYVDDSPLNSKDRGVLM